MNGIQHNRMSYLLTAKLFAIGKLIHDEVGENLGMGLRVNRTGFVELYPLWEPHRGQSAETNRVSCSKSTGIMNNVTA